MGDDEQQGNHALAVLLSCLKKKSLLLLRFRQLGCTSGLFCLHPRCLVRRFCSRNFF